MRQINRAHRPTAKRANQSVLVDLRAVAGHGSLESVSYTHLDVYKRQVKLITYYNENKDQYFTTTERIARQILKDTTSKEYAVEGYIFENNPVVLTFP